MTIRAPTSTPITCTPAWPRRPRQRRPATRRSSTCRRCAAAPGGGYGRPCARPARMCRSGRLTRISHSALSNRSSGLPPRSTSARCWPASARRYSRTALRSTTTPGSARSRRRSSKKPSGTSTSSGPPTPPARRCRKTICSRGCEPGHDRYVAGIDNPGAAGDNAGAAGNNPGVAGDDPGASDLVTAAVAELYDADPQEFTDRRKALAAAARAAGDAAAAKQIAALRKPTRAAWVVNRLARTDPGAPARLASLAAALQAAQQAKDGPRLRELSAARGPLIDALAGQALDAAGVPDPPAGLREEVTETLTAALADPDVAAGFASGTLTRAVQWAGFGVTPFGGTADDSGPADALAASEPLPAQEGTWGDWSPD